MTALFPSMGNFWHMHKMNSASLAGFNLQVLSLTVFTLPTPSITGYQASVWGHAYVYDFIANSRKWIVVSVLWRGENVYLYAGFSFISKRLVQFFSNIYLFNVHWFSASIYSVCGCQICWNYSYRQLRAALWELGIEPSQVFWKRSQWS